MFLSGVVHVCHACEKMCFFADEESVLCCGLKFQPVERLQNKDKV